MNAAASMLASGDAVRPLIDTVLGAMEVGERQRGGPLPPGGPDAVSARVTSEVGDTFLPETGSGATEALTTFGQLLSWGAADSRDPLCAAHLHCPALAVAVAADLAVTTLNPSLDSWDQAPAGVAVEAGVVRALAALTGLPAGADGAITSGATESNLLGVLLARLHKGSDLAVVCSAAAHFSVRQAAHVVGLDDHAVIAVPVDDGDRIDVAAVDRVLSDLGPRPAVVVATAGTTDLGAIDPLDRLTAMATRYGAWLHVDAAYGGGALFSDRLRPLLRGLGAADSIALDLHKLGWQPVPAGVALVRHAELLAPLHRRAAYLNPSDDEDHGYVGRLSQSLRTTRRPDAFSVAVTMRALGRRGLGDLVDRCHELARYAAAILRADGRFSVVGEPTLTTVVFRYTAGDTAAEQDAINARLRRRLLRSGTAVIGRTERQGRTFLKLTLLNPAATPAAIDTLIAAVADAGAAEATPADGSDTTRGAA